METKEMTAFTTLYEERSLPKAANLLYITPQGLSRILKGLEEELSTQLFRRTTQGLIPTETGELFYRQAREILKIYDNTLRCIDNVERNNRVLSIVCGYGAIESLPYSRLLHFQETHPNMKIRWQEYPDEEAERLLEKGNYDLALLPFGNFTLGDDYADIPLYQKQVVAVVYAGHPFWDKKELYLRDLSGEKVIIEASDFRINHAIRSQCAEQDISLDFSAETGDIFFLHQLVELRQGIGISVGFVTERMESPQIRLIPIVDAKPWPVSLVYSRQQVLSSNAQAFKDYLLKCFPCTEESQ